VGAVASLVACSCHQTKLLSLLRRCPADSTGALLAISQQATHWSQSNCTSRWRLWGASFMAKMGDPGTSPCTCLKAIRTSSSLPTYTTATEPHHVMSLRRPQAEDVHEACLPQCHALLMAYTRPAAQSCSVCLAAALSSVRSEVRHHTSHLVCVWEGVCNTVSQTAIHKIPVMSSSTLANAVQTTLQVSVSTRQVSITGVNPGCQP